MPILNLPVFIGSQNLSFNIRLYTCYGTYNPVDTSDSGRLRQPQVDFCNRYATAK